MAAIELSPISEHLSDDEVEALEAALAEVHSSPLDVDEQAQTTLLDSDIDDDLFAEFMDRLEVHDAACEVYVPPDFEDVLTVGEHQIGSAHMLLLVLEELREELFVDEDEEEDEEEDEDNYDLENADDPFMEEGAAASFDFKEKQLRQLWHVLQQGAKLCIQQGVCMFLLE